MKDRHRKILNLINEKGKVSVKELSELFAISTVTIRKDLELLEQEGLLKRSHGYATRMTKIPIDSRMADHYEEKLAVAKKAAEMVAPYETVMMESGSTCALLAVELVSKSVIIVTNAVYVARQVQLIPNSKVILLGGEFEYSGEVTIGPITQLCAAEYHVDKFFVGMDGYTEEDGFTNLDYTRNATIRAMAKQANKVIVLSPSCKFGKRSVSTLLAPEEVHTVVTDCGLDGKYYRSLRKQGIEVRMGVPE